MTHSHATEAVSFWNPTQSERVMHRRDAVFLERMRPLLEAGRTVVLVGSAHLIHSRGMLQEAGFAVRKSK